jgi:hypothetical protein
VKIDSNIVVVVIVIDGVQVCKLRVMRSQMCNFNLFIFYNKCVTLIKRGEISYMEHQCIMDDFTCYEIYLNERKILLKNIFKLEIELKILVKLEETPIYIYIYYFDQFFVQYI